jgi:uncharacterized membrane protein HdeD (DUF308 family)
MKSSVWWLIGGIVSIIGGLLALFNPFSASLTAELVAAFGFLVGGAVMIVGLFSQEKAGTKLWMGLLGVALVLIGYQLFAHPLVGLVSLTIALGILLIFEGATKLFLTFTLDRGNGFWLMLLSSVLSFILAVMIFSDFALSATTMLGIFLGVDLLMTGVSMIVLWNETKNNVRAIA